MTLNKNIYVSIDLQIHQDINVWQQDTFNAESFLSIISSLALIPKVGHHF
jgi:hypothetical protein